MKKGYVAAGAVVLALGGVGAAVVSQTAGQAAFAADTMVAATPMLSDFGAKGGPAAFAEKLDLTEAQRAQIKTIVQGEKPVVAPLVHELGATWKTVQAQTNTGTVDQSQIQSEIDADQPAIASLIVEAARTKTEIYNTVLTPAQKKEAQAMMADADGRLQEHLNQAPAMADRFVSMASWKLNLSDDQKAQIKSLLNAGVQQNLPLVKQLAAEREAIKTATAEGRFDEAEVQRLAQPPAKTATQLAANVAVLKTQVFAVLTPEQRQQVEQFQAKRHSHRMAWLRQRFGGGA
jgi:Spy/CpxP family protein refolding chaperone